MTKKHFRLFNPLLAMAFFIACAGNMRRETNTVDSVRTTASNFEMPLDSFVTGKVVSSIQSKSDPTQSWALYIPHNKMNEHLPIVYFFDPHGIGVLPLTKYQAIAERYGFILVGSNNSKNGNDWDATRHIVDDLFADTKKRLKINADRIYVAGFSGGAKAATAGAMAHREVKGVIANGAVLENMTAIGNLPFTFTAIAGEGDLNMTDLVAATAELDKTQTRHRILFFEGKHEWAPESTMNLAFAGLELDAMHDKLMNIDAIFVKRYGDESKARITEFLKSNDYLKAEAECKLSEGLLQGLSNQASWFKEKDLSLRNNTNFNRQQQARQGLLNKEEYAKTQFQQQFGQPDMGYWQKTIGDLQAKAAGHSGESAMNQRLLAYLSLAFYSISNQLISTNRNQQAKYYVDLYKTVDASNSEAWYFSAILNARNNNSTAAQNDLVNAVERGFNDKARMRAQPEFAKLQLNFVAIESKMKNQ